MKFDEAGTYTVSAVSEEGTIVPPVCVVTVAKSDNGDPDDTPDEVPAFTDIAGHWGEEAIKYTAEKGYLMGISDTEFAPDVDVSRAMIVTVLYRIEGEPEVKAENPFTDLEDNTWYTDAVLWAAENELVLGYNDTYRAGDTLTRREAALILYRWAQFKEYELAEAADLSSYEDAGTVDDWALEAMAWADVYKRQALPRPDVVVWSSWRSSRFLRALTCAAACANAACSVMRCRSYTAGC